MDPSEKDDEEARECPDCLGGGYTPCEHCDGEGAFEFECPTCGLVHDVDCHVCEGTGDSGKCETCDGTGILEE